MNVGDTDTLIATIQPPDADGTGTWSSTDTEVVTVDSSGNIEAVGRGEEDIVFEFEMENGYTYSSTCTVNVIQQVTGVELVANLSISIHEEATLSATVKPSNANNQNVTWESSDTDIATIDSNGLVTGEAEGTATITVTTEDGGFTAECDVEVTDDLSTIQAALDGITSLSIENPNGPSRVWGRYYDYPTIQLPDDVGDVEFTFQ